MLANVPSARIGRSTGGRARRSLVRGVAQPVAERMADAVMGSTNAGAWDVGVMRESFAKA